MANKFEQRKPSNNVGKLLQKLDELYEKEEQIIKNTRILMKEYQQLQEDKELLQSMIMHQSNKANRLREVFKK